MDIILNSDLKKIERQQKVPKIESFIDRICYKLDKNSPNIEHKFIGTNIDTSTISDLQLGFVGCLSEAYSRHEKVVIAPHDIWYLVLSEIATIIKQNEVELRSAFTSSTNKVEISVPTADITGINLGTVIAQLAILMPTSVDLFIPTLSTETEDSRMALCAALCDGVQAYYSYATFMCGIPEVRVTGTEEDWYALIHCTTEIAKVMKFYGVDNAVHYLVNVGDLLSKVIKSVEKPDPLFWTGIFTSTNIGSGGELNINGWITDLYFKKFKINKLENFLTTLSIVPYHNLETGRKFKGVYGPFIRARTSDDFLETRYANMVFEVDEKTKSKKLVNNILCYEN
jgi:hypothetical protein